MLSLKKCSWEIENVFDNNGIIDLKERERDMVIILSKDNSRYQDHNAKFCRDLSTIKLEISLFLGEK